MAKPVCRIMIPAPLPEAFEFMAGQLEASGLNRTHPDNGLLVTLGSNCEAKLLSQGNLQVMLAAGGAGNLAFWPDGTREMILTWKPEREGYMFSLRLENMDSTQVVILCARLAEAVLTHFAERYSHDQALVIAFA